MMDIAPGMHLDRYKTHDIEIVIDRFTIEEDKRDRLISAVALAFKMGNDFVMIVNLENDEMKAFSKSLMDPVSGLSYEEPSPNNFSFNSPYGACKECNGIGEIHQADMEKLYRTGLKVSKKKPLNHWVR